MEAVGEPLLDGGEVAEAVAKGVPVEPGQPRVVPLVLGCDSIDISGTSPTRALMMLGVLRRILICSSLVRGDNTGG